MVKVEKDMTGWNMWEHGFPESIITVVKQTEDYIDSNGQHYDQWICHCNCNGDRGDFVVRGSSLRKGRPFSCGCLTKEKLTGRPKKHNEYLDEIFEDEYGKYRIGFTSNTKEEFYFNPEDYDKIKDYTWYSLIDRSTKELGAWDNNRKSRILMHQLLGFSEYDHIDRNELNNRRENLRLCTKSENKINSSKRNDNTSGFIGVGYNKNDAKWWVRISINKKYKLIGRYLNKEDAIVARLKAEKEYYGEFAPQRHLFESYGI